MKSYPLLALFALVLALATPATAQTTPATTAKKVPFHGKLSAVDTTANTITLQGKTTTRVFHLTPDTKITDGSGNPSTLAAAVVGIDVGGSYTKDASGTMTLYSVRFGTKTGSTKTATTSTTAPPTAPAAPAPAPAPAAAPATAPAPAAAPATAAKVKKLSFSGKVVSVDATANTIVIHGKADQIYTATATTKITDSTGAAATLAAATVGSKVTGTYSKSTDGSALTL